MAHSNELSSVLTTVKGLLSKHTFLYDHFEHTLKDVITSCTLTDLVNSTIPTITIRNALQTALESTANLALDESRAGTYPDLKTISEQLWNPLVATMIAVLFKRTVPVTEKKSQSSTKVPKAKKKLEPVEKIVVPLPSPDEVEKIHEKLKSVALTRPRLYANSGHIQCDKDNCAFCVHMFHNVNITPCKGHKKCNSSGWYPHVGKPLWSQLKAKHSAAVPCRLRPKECGPQEIPALLAQPIHNGLEKTSGVSGDSELMDESSQMSQESDTRSTCHSLPETVSWAEDVEDMIRKRRRIGFQSAPSSPAH